MQLLGVRVSLAVAGLVAGLLPATISCSTEFIDWRLTSTDLEDVSLTFATNSSFQCKTLRLHAIARRFQPQLWFSPDEFLLKTYSSGGVVELPRDFSNERGPVVYFHIERVTVQQTSLVDPTMSLLRNEARVPIAFFENGEWRLATEAIRLIYVFYYPEDRGSGHHEHDIEELELQLRCVRLSGGTFGLRRERVIGYAHKLPTYENRLRLTYQDGPTSASDSALVVLVEENKHASCPDRNGDGVYTPGVDVNEGVRSAWGVRDVIADTGWRATIAGWQPEYAKARAGHPVRDIELVGIEYDRQRAADVARALHRKSPAKPTSVGTLGSSRAINNLIGPLSLTNSWSDAYRLGVAYQSAAPGWLANASISFRHEWAPGHGPNYWGVEYCPRFACVTSPFIGAKASDTNQLHFVAGAQVGYGTWMQARIALDCLIRRDGRLVERCLSTSLRQPFDGFTVRAPRSLERLPAA